MGFWVQLAKARPVHRSFDCFRSLRSLPGTNSGLGGPRGLCTLWGAAFSTASGAADHALAGVGGAIDHYIYRIYGIYIYALEAPESCVLRCKTRRILVSCRWVRVSQSIRMTSESSRRVRAFENSKEMWIWDPLVLIQWFQSE